MNKQYTIRSIPEPVDNVLRKQALKTGKSFNSVVVEALQKATGVSKDKISHTDLDSLIGIGISDKKSFDTAMCELEENSSQMDSNFSL